AARAGPARLGRTVAGNRRARAQQGQTVAFVMETAQKNPAAANLVHIPGFLLLGGGVPVKVGNDVIGAIGVGGAPGGHLDEQCAVSAIEKAKDLLK
ncbi:MAG: heme-binding protein, partial [Rubrivivax sp.]|nr:heme-binding protein [Rubrivivax sp.]